MLELRLLLLACFTVLAGLCGTVCSQTATPMIAPTGSPKALVILMEYKDVHFRGSDPRAEFDALLNQKGYSQNGAVGSVKDYFVTNSMGKFSPQFVVAGPVRLDENRADYEFNYVYFKDRRDEAFQAAVQKAVEEKGVNLSDFDRDKDNVLDAVIFYYAGHNSMEATDLMGMALESHQGNLLNFDKWVGDMRLGFYACVSELNGPSSSTKMSGISAFCHEFGHILGLPEFYDTDPAWENEEQELFPNGTLGPSAGLMSCSVMANGAWNAQGYVPPLLTALERMMLGWLTPEALQPGSDYVLEPLEKNKAYIVNTGNEGEYFLLENRNADNMYDSKISRNTGGMIISHIDCSDNLTFKQTVAKELWKTGTPNKYLSHSCAKWVKVKGNDDYRLNYFQIDDLLLPGANNIQTIQFTPWSGEAMDKKLISITKEGVNIRFRFEGTIITSEKVEISQTSASLQLLNTLQLSAQVFPDKAEDKRIVWSSSNEKIASVDVNGLVTAVSPGVATITALAGDGKSEATCEVTVYAEGSTIIEPAQREVHVSWGGTEEPQTWIVRYKKSADEEFETMEVSGETMCILHYLTPDTEYVLQVCALIGNAESGNVVDATFKTEALNGDFHRIRGIRKDWKEGDRFWPVVDNIHKQVLKTVWKLDDDVFSDKEELVLPGGTHRLQVEVTTADGMTETIVRQIKVESKTEEQ